jgi:thiosulfate/3-mercaptopyruvate sulfurtransferase
MLISTDNLKQIFQDENLLIVDTRSFGEYSKGHIPTAVNLDLFAFHWFDTSQNGIKSFNDQTRKILSYTGIDERKKIVFYDNISGMLAARGVWLCQYFSHPDVSMLDGGFTKWKNEKFPIEIEPTKYSPSNLTTLIDTSIISDFEYIKENIGKITIIDARSKDEFDGTIPRAARGGHIPTAVNIDWNKNLEQELFKSDEQLSTLYKMDKETHIVTYCQGAYRAANSFLALKKIGFKNVKVYLGSWGEWGNNLELPVE